MYKNETNNSEQSLSVFVCVGNFIFNDAYLTYLPLGHECVVVDVIGQQTFLWKFKKKESFAVEKA